MLGVRDETEKSDYTLVLGSLLHCCRQRGILRAAEHRVKLRAGLIRFYTAADIPVFSLYQSVGACTGTCNGYAFAILQGHVSFNARLTH